MILTAIERQRFDAKWEPEPNSGCWLWTAGVLVCGGYGAFRAGGKLVRAHRVSYELNVGPIPDGALMLHSCDNPVCINPRHLRPGTYSENLQDCISRGRANRARGERAPRARLTADQVVQIRALWAAGARLRPLGRQFGVRAGSIKALVTRKTWRHVA